MEKATRQRFGRGNERVGLLPALLCLLALLPRAHAARSQEFRIAEPGYEFSFPRDHGSHPGFRTEWWYYTGHLEARSGKRYGFEVTFFRVGVDPNAEGKRTAWDLTDLALAHFAVSDLDEEEFRYYERLNRVSPFTADAREGRLDVFNEGWRTSMLPDGSIALEARADGDAISLNLAPRKPPAIHGENGVSVKALGRGYASHYYSLTRLEARGTITIEGRTEPCSGLAWMDHEFGSAVLRENQTGWDWFSVQLDDDTELMLYAIRKNDGTPDVTSSGSFVAADGSVVHLAHTAFRIRAIGSWKSVRSGATYPMGWIIEVPSLDLRLEIEEEMKAQELMTQASTQVTYWEGAVRVSGRVGSIAVRGAGYVEMTGYDRPFRR